jgi:hypothetical protein
LLGLEGFSGDAFVGQVFGFVLGKL